MGMFAMRKPRGFHHSYIYVDERKEKLAKMEEDAKRELGMLPGKGIFARRYPGGSSLKALPSETS